MREGDRWVLSPAGERLAWHALARGLAGREDLIASLCQGKAHTLARAPLDPA